MAQMTDPTLGMESFQEALEHGRLLLEPARLDPDLYVYRDTELGSPRCVYARAAGRSVLAYVCFVLREPVDGSPCFQVGYAVPAAHRNQGRATDVFRAGIAELQNEFAGYPSFYVEAIVGLDNVGSQKVATKILACKPNAIVDGISGQPALQYLRKLEPRAICT